jgi:putative aminopeptidase FrvX
MTIPEVRDELFKLAGEHGIPRLTELANELFRRRLANPKPPKARTATPSLKAQIRAYAKANPAALQREIADHFKVDGGRVHEALHGKRT